MIALIEKCRSCGRPNHAVNRNIPIYISTSQLLIGREAAILLQSSLYQQQNLPFMQAVLLSTTFPFNESGSRLLRASGVLVHHFDENLLYFCKRLTECGNKFRLASCQTGPQTRPHSVKCFLFCRRTQQLLQLLSECVLTDILTISSFLSYQP